MSRASSKAGPRARTSADSEDPGLTGRTYGIPFIRIWVAVVALANRGRWTATHTDEDEGVVKAEHRTRVFGFVDDVVVTVSLDADAQTRVDMESSSRIGAYDFGTNRRRIRRFMSDLDRAVLVEPTPALRPHSAPPQPHM